MSTHLVATRSDRPEHSPEAEPVLIETTAEVVRLELDDGITLDFDRRELLAALAAA